jgi:hypothetical protein
LELESKRHGHFHRYFRLISMKVRTKLGEYLKIAQIDPEFFSNGLA